ncbi:RluA family pseudouridine synthase [Candidatus Gottesmanbacteria bacterium]|nr:RluA family pseudouridine synthase [Candidatus Gottesmanbacteria bacterium]
MDIPILYEDEILLVINKPPGIVVNRADTVSDRTVEDWVRDTYHITIDRAGIVHRIDKETSGILLIAKTPEAFGELQRQFKAREVKKTYLALVHGNLVPAQGEIRAPVGRLPWNPERFGIVPGGKEAVTRYKVVSRQSSVVRKSESGKLIADSSFVELYPETGRTHQIRVHLKYINHPIIGDYLYAGRKVSRSDRVWAPRVMLHAWKISFTHPGTGKTLAFEAPIPQDMNRIIQSDQSDQ